MLRHRVDVATLLCSVSTWTLRYDVATLLIDVAILSQGLDISLLMPLLLHFCLDVATLLMAHFLMLRPYLYKYDLFS